MDAYARYFIRAYNPVYRDRGFSSKHPWTHGANLILAFFQGRRDQRRGIHQREKTISVDLSRTHVHTYVCARVCVCVFRLPIHVRLFRICVRRRRKRIDREIEEKSRANPAGIMLGIIGDPVGNLASMVLLFCCGIGEKGRETTKRTRRQDGGNGKPLSIYSPR